MTLALTDATIRDLLVGIVGNGLWSLVAQSGAKASQKIRALVSPPQPAVVVAIRTASDRLKASIESSTAATQERLIAYLKSPEVESIVRQLFATSLVQPTDSSTPHSIKREFISSMSKHLDINESRLQPFAASFLNGLIASVEDALRAAIEKNVLSAHEAQSAARHRILLDEILNLQENVAFLGSESSLDVTAILEFENKYRELLGSVHAHIKPPHLDSGRRVPIDEIFVAPHISWVPRQNTEGRGTLALPAFLSGLYRAVLLGNPGGGKSTTSAKICYDLATRYSDRQFAGREITPALVILREYGSQKKASNCSIVQFLEQQASSRYQLKSPANAFEYLLLNGRLLIIFDGLDELLDSSYRQEITSNVETFCKLYPSVPVLVTSREVGYEQAPLNEKLFELFQLAPFDEQQVQEYAGKWFARDEDYSPEQKTQKARAFFVDSAFVPDLRSNPLMLGLMCNLYRVEGYIPRNRPEVYGKCSVMLFERWDKSRDILVPLPFEEHIRPAMQDLAFWIYSNEELQGGVTEEALIERTSNYLCKWVFDDVLKANLAASDFVRFCTGRAWVFTDTGTTGAGERLFQFTHRTFLEYFTACYLVSVHPTPEPLMDSLRAHVAKGEWDVVAQLAFQIQSKQVHGAADELLSLLLPKDACNPADLWNILSFAERSLEFLVPSPKMRREITRAALGFWLAYVRRDRGSEFDAPREASRGILEHIGNLLLVSPENRDTVADEIELFLKDAVVSADIEVSASAATLTVDLTHPLAIEHRRQVTSDVREYWEKVSGRIVTSTMRRILEIAHLRWSVALRCYWRDLIPLSEGIAAFGIPFLLVPVQTPALGDVWVYAPGHMLLDWVLYQESAERREGLMDALESLSEVFLRTQTPWVRKEHLEEDPPEFVTSRPGRQEPTIEAVTLSPNAKFSAICLFAGELERLDLGAGQNEPETFLRRENRLPEDVRRVLLGRFADGSRGEALYVLDSLAFSTPQREFLGRWINSDIDLVEATAPSRPRRRSRSPKGRTR